jgi:hypothetical protein
MNPPTPSELCAPRAHSPRLPRPRVNAADLMRRSQQTILLPEGREASVQMRLSAALR